ncbi:ABC-type multidrug transport system, ATPase and permease component [Enterocytozoon bieneusi H348]|nr:ABC-type multidrug transport system, ATPase and permease component [Enterocytozoon bieneusi H348]|eukprot:XP_001827920.1 ABC-type multidrug transport system, ATPase and permease component [Enterocytozoon bieneusi H348]
MTKEFAQHICSQINAPICNSVNLETTSYVSRSGNLFGIIIDSPYTFMLNICGILLGLRMYYNTSNMHACIGKSEIKWILFLFIVNNILLILTINFQNFINGFSTIIYDIIAAFQLTIFTTYYFTVFASGITIDKIHGIMKMNSGAFLSTLSSIFICILSSFNIISIVINNYFLLLGSIIMNTISILMYIGTQTRKLKKIKSDIWAYGILSILFSIYIISLIPIFVGADIISILTEKNLDNFFIFHSLNTIFMLMLHKYWLSTCDFEIECLELEV